MGDKEFVVFYAWQSDSPAKTNRNFIEDALKDALKKLKRQGKIEPSPRIDKDTKDVPGIPDIANTILEKINSDDAFLADVSMIGNISKSNPSEVERIPNPNVMIELGYALAKLGPERIVLVMNTSTGSQDDMPFDLRTRRWPIAYELSEDADSSIIKEQKINLSDQLQKAIEMIVKLPEREKQRTPEKHLDDIEENLSILNDTISDMANQISDINSRTLPSIHISENKQSILHEHLNSLIEKVKANDFYDFPVGVSSIVLTICPTSKQESFSLSETKKENLLKLRPLGSGGWDSNIFGNSSVTVSKRNSKIDAVTEITEEGLINAAGRDIIGNRRDSDDDTLYIPSIGYEKDIIEAVWSYFDTLTDLGVKGPYQIALGLIEINNSLLYVGPAFGHQSRLFQGDRIIPPRIEIPDGIDLNNPQEIARQMRKIFDYIWREYNFPKSLNYSKNGDWVGR